MNLKFMRRVSKQEPAIRQLRKKQIDVSFRGIEWCLPAFASMRAVRLFLRARAVINFLMRAASTLEITNGEQRALRKFSANWNLSFNVVTGQKNRALQVPPVVPYKALGSFSKALYGTTRGTCSARFFRLVMCAK